MSTTVVRILIILGATCGALVGAFVAVAKTVPERAGIITTYQLKVIKALQDENNEQAEKMREMRNEIITLRGEVEELKREKVG